MKEGPLLARYNIQDIGGTAKAVAEGVAIVEGDAAGRQPGRHATTGAGEPHLMRRPAVRRLRRLLRHHRQSRRWALRSTCLVTHGGTAILSETPEIYGAEHLLTRRADVARSRRED